jgi:hypothetical protein
VADQIPAQRERELAALEYGSPEYNHELYLRKNARVAKTCADCGTDIAYTSTRCIPCEAKLKPASRRLRSDGWTRERAIEAVQAWAQVHGGDPPTVSEADASGSPVPCKSSAKILFGSWAAMIEAAGFTPRRPGENRRTTRSEKAEGPRTRNRQMVRGGVQGAKPHLHGSATARDHKIP